MATWTPFFGRWLHGRINVITDEAYNAGRILFVDSNNGTDAVGYGGSPATPYATIAQAYATCVTGEGWKVILMPGHAEVVDLAAWLTIAKSNIEFIGIGNAGFWPTFTFEGGDAIPLIDINVDAANITFKHIRFLNSEDPLTGALDINAANCTFDDCIFEDEGTDNTVDWLVLDANADGFLARNCRNYGTDTAGNDAWISMAAVDHVRILNCYSHGDFAAGNVELTAAATDLEIGHCLMEQVNGVDVNVEGFAAATGMIHHSGFQITGDGILTWVNTLGNLTMVECYGTNNNGETGLLCINGAVTPLCTVP